MSESTAKATRQQLRQAFGPEADDVMQRLAENTANLGANQRYLRGRVDSLDGAHNTLAMRVQSHVERTLIIQRDLTAFQSRTFWQRLKWLCLGT